MKLAVDVRYQSDRATTGGVLFEHWTDPQPMQELVCHRDSFQDAFCRIKDYEPEQFYKRAVFNLVD